MRKSSLLLTLLFITSTTIFAQENDEVVSRHEIKLNVLYTVFGIPEVTYEYLLNEKSAIGTSLMVALDNDIDFNFSFTPFFRYYFGEKYAAGFFVEGFGMLNSERIHTHSSGCLIIHTNTNGVDFALGGSVGAKFLSKNNWIGEVHAGLGLNLFNGNNTDIVPRIGISVGKRF